MQSTLAPTLRTGKPAGGFVFLTAQQLCLLWWLYRIHHLQLRDLRVWFACHEMVARRCQLGAGQSPVYTLPELHRLVGGVGGEHLRASLRRLEALGLLTWSAARLTFATSPQDVQGLHDLTGCEAMLAALPHPGRRIPVPRRTLRFLARRVPRVLVATILGHLLRCLYFRQGHCVGTGFCKASWITTVFHVSHRNVKLARQRLATLGWLTPVATPTWVRNRYGQKVQINLAWAGFPATTAHPLETPSCPPPPPLSPTHLAPPDSYPEPLTGSFHQEPSRERPSGILPGPSSAPQRPTLHDMTVQDLRQTDRLLQLYAQATDQGLLLRSDAARLQFVAAAEHALALGRTPERLFAHLLRHQLWQVITLADEDAARRRLHALTAPVGGRLAPFALGALQPPPGAARATTLPALSHDALVVQTLTADLRRTGYTGPLLPLVQRHGYLPDWTPTRWEQAVQDLAYAARGSPPCLPVARVFREEVPLRAG